MSCCEANVEPENHEKRLQNKTKNIAVKYYFSVSTMFSLNSMQGYYRYLKLVRK